MPRLDSLRMALFTNPDARGANPHVVLRESPEDEGRRLNAQRYETVGDALTRSEGLPPLGEPDPVQPAPLAPPPPRAQEGATLGGVFAAIGVAAFMVGTLWLVAKVSDGPRRNPDDDDDDDDDDGLDLVPPPSSQRTRLIAPPDVIPDGQQIPHGAPVVVIVNGAQPVTVPSGAAVVAGPAPSPTAPALQTTLASTTAAPVAESATQTVVTESVTVIDTKQKKTPSRRRRSR